MQTITNKIFDEERALYGLKDISVKDCVFDGLSDGESAFKEGYNVRYSIFRIWLVCTGYRNGRLHCFE